MLNQTVLVGRLVENVKIEQVDKISTIKIAVPRMYKNENGEYDTDIIPVKLLNMLSKNIIEYCNKGDLLGIKGRIQSNNENIELVAEKITFLSSKKEIVNNE